MTKTNVYAAKQFLILCGSCAITNTNAEVQDGTTPSVQESRPTKKKSTIWNLFVSTVKEEPSMRTRKASLLRKDSNTMIGEMIMVMTINLEAQIHL